MHTTLVKKPAAAEFSLSPGKSVQPLQHSTHTSQNTYGFTYRIFRRLYWSLCFYTLRLAAVLSSMAPRQSITPQYCSVWGCRQQQLA